MPFLPYENITACRKVIADLRDKIIDIQDSEDSLLYREIEAKINEFEDLVDEANGLIGDLGDVHEEPEFDSAAFERSAMVLCKSPKSLHDFTNMLDMAANWDPIPAESVGKALQFAGATFPGGEQK